ncbi:LysR family transcriptional regulator [Salinarimonas chemoclinalis]|uniref:LysR family transcriptional regulator n=1 Tax=Salinarimonas chemoclinalis TaxID=3241599 RepID=UPI0035577AFD
MDTDRFLRLDERSLQYFLAVYASGSLRRASDALRLTPSAVGRKILELEHRLGTPLFERHARGSVPTPAAHVLAGHLRERNRRDHLVLEQIAALQGLERGEVTICTGEGFAYDMMRTVLTDFMRAHPGILVRLTVAPTERIIEDLLLDRADIGMAYDCAPSPKLEVAARARDPLCAVVRADHPMARLESADIADFAELPAALHAPRSGIRALVEKALAGGERRPSLRLETNSLHLLRLYAARGLGVTFLPRSAVDDLREGEWIAPAVLVAIPLRDEPARTAANQIFLRRERVHSAAVTALVARAARQMAAFGRPVAGSDGEGG